MIKKTNRQTKQTFRMLVLSGLLLQFLTNAIAIAASSITFLPSIQIDRRPDNTGWGPIATDGKNNIYSNYWGG